MLGAEIELLPFCEAHLDSAVALFVEVFAAEPWNEVWSRPSAQRRLGDLVRSPGFMGVAALRGGELVGFALGRLEAYREEEHYHLQEMCVSTQCQRQGVGTKIVAYLQERLEERGCKQIYLLTMRESAPEAFYLQCDFSPSRHTAVMVKKLI